MSHRTDSLWSEDGLIRAGSRQNMRKGQVYRASPPAHLPEALDRQRRLLHGQDLRNYWNLPKAAIFSSVPTLFHSLLLRQFEPYITRVLHTVSWTVWCIHDQLLMQLVMAYADCSRYSSNNSDPTCHELQVHMNVGMNMQRNSMYKSICTVHSAGKATEGTQQTVLASTSWYNSVTTQQHPSSERAV